MEETYSVFCIIVFMLHMLLKFFEANMLVITYLKCYVNLQRTEDKYSFLKKEKLISKFIVHSIEIP